LHMIMGASWRPKNGAGEDALCGDITSGFIGVADGVGGSRTDLIDPGAYSRRLLAYCHRHSALGLDAATILQLGRASAAKDILTQRGGSSTLLVATLQGETINIANLGDSAAVLLRPAMREMRIDQVTEDKSNDKAMVLYPRPVLRTHEQSFYFNCPYQSSANDDLDKSNSLGSCDFDSLSVTARPGDILLLATDGLWDNLHDNTIERLCLTYIPHLWSSAARHGALWVPEIPQGKEHLIALSDDDLAHKSPADVLAHVAARLTETAVEVYSNEESVGTPFTRAARIEGYDYKGGKVDDVSVMLALIVPDDANGLAVAVTDFDDPDSSKHEQNIIKEELPENIHKHLLFHNFGSFALDNDIDDNTLQNN